MDLRWGYAQKYDGLYDLKAGGKAGLSPRRDNYLNMGITSHTS